jgi:hypothetical protein
VKDDDDALQEAIHAELAALLREDALAEGEVLTGWVVAYEAQTAKGEAHAGHLYGPATMTTWRALGLIEWARLHTLKPNDDD